MSVSFLTAFLAGLISFLSPCVLPLVPAYLCYLVGSSYEELTEGVSGRGMQRRVFLASVLFVAGFGTVFVLLGASASAVGQVLRVYQDILTKIAGVAIVLFGLHFLGVFRMGFLNIEKRFAFHGDTPLNAYGMGLAFAFGWTPCIGPVLATILVLAAQEETLAQGMLLLATYSLGLGLPFIVAAAALPFFLRTSGRFKNYMHWVEKVAGAGLVLTGALFISGNFTWFANWLVETFPALTNLG